ncbi:MAG: methyltransferase [Chitinophagaceae bacterium]|nr:methyltransferase [Chitinophagaceae bacterium]
MLPPHLHTFAVADTAMEIFVPNAEAVLRQYANNKESAYWAQVWPASIGLCNFLHEYPHYIEGKNIMELAAGLGLPGLYAATIAKHVAITDREEQAVACLQQSITHLQLQNAHAVAMDWKDAVHAPLPDVLLLSDVNYAPAVFGELMHALEYFLQNKVPVIISTPQRLVAKPFINSLLPYCIQQWSYEAALNGNKTGVSVFVLEGYSKIN